MYHSPAQTKSDLKQRIIIIIIAVLLLASTIMAYIFIVIGSSNSSTSNAELVAKQETLTAAVAELSDQYFDQFAPYRSEVKSFNATSANSAGLKTRDLKVGTGATLAENDSNYYAYYIGFCPNESVFDTSFLVSSRQSDDTIALATLKESTSLGAPIPGSGLIDGWTQGVVGMKIGGVREISIPGPLAYGESREICGATNSPLKFIVMAIEPSASYITALTEYQNAYYGR